MSYHLIPAQTNYKILISELKALSKVYAPYKSAVFLSLLNPGSADYSHEVSFRIDLAKAKTIKHIVRLFSQTFLTTFRSVPYTILKKVPDPQDYRTEISYDSTILRPLTHTTCGMYTALSSLRLDYANVKTTSTAGKVKAKVPEVVKLKLNPAAESLAKLTSQCFVATHDIPELQEDGETYRCLATPDYVELCVPSSHYSYDYLDKGRIIFPFSDESGTKRGIVVAEEFSMETALIFKMITMDGKQVERLQTKCFLAAKNAKMVQLQMEKHLPTRFKKPYGVFKALVLKEYSQNAQVMILDKFIKKEIKNLELNEIKFTQDEARYENITVQMPDLLKHVMESVDLTGEFDIYNVVEAAGKHIQTTFEARVSRLQDNEAGGTDRVYDAMTCNLSINNIPIEVSVDGNNVRKINGKRIRHDELHKVISRAACYQDAEEYARFIRTVSSMSLRVRDALANGVGLNIKEPLDGSAVSAIPGPTAPKLRFKYENRAYHLKTSDTAWIRMYEFPQFLEKVSNLNTALTSQWSRRSGERKLQDRITSHTATRRKVVNPGAEPFIEIVNVLNDESYEDLLGYIDKQRGEAYKKALLLLKKVVSQVKAKEGEREGHKGYIVKGKLTTYFVEKDTCKVWNHKTGKYICIVNATRDRLAGYDELAGRLAALRNDSKVMSKIHTLQSLDPANNNSEQEYQDGAVAEPEADKVLEVKNSVVSQPSQPEPVNAS